MCAFISLNFEHIINIVDVFSGKGGGTGEFEELRTMPGFPWVARPYIIKGSQGGKYIFFVSLKAYYEIHRAPSFINFEVPVCIVIFVIIVFITITRT